MAIASQELAADPRLGGEEELLVVEDRAEYDPAAYFIAEAQSMTMRTTISLPGTLMSEIDGLVGPRGRSGFLARAARNELKRERLRTALDAARGALVGTPGWRSGDEIVRFVDDLRSDERDPWAPGETVPERE